MKIDVVDTFHAVLYAFVNSCCNVMYILIYTHLSAI